MFTQTFMIMIMNTTFLNSHNSDQSHSAMKVWLTMMSRFTSFGLHCHKVMPIQRADDKTLECQINQNALQHKIVTIFFFYCETREHFWIHHLKTLQPLGLNANDEKRYKRKRGNPVATATTSNQSGTARGQSSQS